MESIVIHYDEIALKKGNRAFFEMVLVKNIQDGLGKMLEKIYKRYGRFVCDLKTDEGVKEILELIPGISYFSFIEKAKLDIEDIKKTALRIAENERFESFRVECKRSNKKFEKTSMEMDKIIGEFILEKTGKKIKMKNPDLTVHVELCEKEVFVYCHKIKGVGGLPVGTSGKLICSLSGGIDSPVSAFMMMKRGCKIVFAHIKNSNITSDSAVEKVIDLVRQLSKVQFESKLFIAPFENIQKQIIMNVPAKYRMIIYRRFMMRIINEVAKKTDAKGVVTGDSIGQVASQTVPNITCVHNASDLPVFSPLIGMNKTDIIETAKKIGTYEYSIIPYPDCCSFMIAEHPETKADLKKIEELENEIKSKEKLVKECVANAELIKIFGHDI